LTRGDLKGSFMRMVKKSVAMGKTASLKELASHLYLVLRTDVVAENDSTIPEAFDMQLDALRSLLDARTRV